MKKKTRIIIIAVFVAVFAILAAVATFFGAIKGTAGTKNFKVNIVSERDSYNETIEVSSDREFLGEYLRETDYCVWTESDYGIYITGFYDMNDDTENQYWWCITVNGENATTGADEIPLTEGDEYTFTLTQGW